MDTSGCKMSKKLLKLILTLGFYWSVVTGTNEPSLSQTLNCSYVIHDIFYNTQACVFVNISLKEDESFTIDTTYEGTFIHPGLFKTIRFLYSDIPYVPPYLFKKFFNAERLYMNATGVIKINGDSFLNAHNIRRIYLSDNQIKVLEDNSFTHAKQASLIDLSYNYLVTFNSKAFDHLAQLRRLYLSHNRISSLDVEAFKLIPTLSVIKLDNNFIKHIEPELFANNLFIEEIDLSHNGIMTLELHLKGDRFRYLNANNNNVQKFFMVADRYVDDVTVDLMNNKLVQFCLPVNVDIVRLNVENNRLGKSLIEISNITAVKSLRELYLGHNMLPSLEVETFAELRNLRYLGLPNTDLHEIRSEVLEPLANLTVFDISYNPLRTIDLNALRPLQNLRSLYINGDELNGMDIKNVKDYLPSIYDIEISDTEWSCVHLQETINEMRNKSVYLIPNKQKLVKRKKNIDGISCYGLWNGTYAQDYLDDAIDKTSDTVKVQSNSNTINWLIIGGCILAIILAILVIYKTYRHVKNRKRSQRHDYHQQPNHRRIFTDVTYSSD